MIVSKTTNMTIELMTIGQMNYDSCHICVYGTQLLVQS